MAAQVPQIYKGPKTAGATVTPIPSVWQRIGQAARYVVSSVTPGTWFGPDQPIPPFAPPETRGRAFDYQIGYNIGITPRAEEPVSFGMMRALADGYDVLRLVLETRKDQIAKMPWNLSYAEGQQEGKDIDDDPFVKQLKDQLIYPDREHAWDAWLRMILEDLLVLDAPVIYPRLTRGGDVYSLDLMDGSMFKRILDPWGRTPLPPDPAYQQVAHGVPMADYTRDEVVYFPRNPRTHKVYGYSPVEQMIVTINIALRREMSQLYYFTEGTMPDTLISLPDEWSPEQLKDYQLWWDGLTGLDDRRKVRFVPGTKGGGSGVTLTKEPALKTDFDEWAVRIICFALSISPQPFIKMMNRATANTASEQAHEEGLVPTLTYLENLMDLLFAKFYKRPDLKFKFDLARDVDPNVQSEIDDRDLRNGTKTLNEVRSNRGDDEYGPFGDRPLLFTATGPVPIDTAIENIDNPPQPPPMAPPPTGGAPPGKPVAAPRPAAQAAPPLKSATAKHLRKTRTVRRYAMRPRS